MGEIKIDAVEEGGEFGWKFGLDEIVVAGFQRDAQRLASGAIVDVLDDDPVDLAVPQPRQKLRRLAHLRRLNRDCRKERHGLFRDCTSTANNTTHPNAGRPAAKRAAARYSLPTAISGASGCF